MSSHAPLKLGTRGSDLARTQSTTVADALRAAGHDVELTIIKTAGDRDQTSQFGSIGAQGIFVREIEQALVEQRIELAVHSFKDLPTTSPDVLVIGAVPKRVDPAYLLLVRSDALSGSATDWLPLKPGARVVFEGPEVVAIGPRFPFHGRLPVRWTPLVGQFGGMDKLGSDVRQAASLSFSGAQYASSGERPASVE